MNDAEEDLRATADAIARDAERLAAIEAEKTQLDISDPRMAELSAQAEAISRNLVPKTAAESELTKDAQA